MTEFQYKIEKNVPLYRGYHPAVEAFFEMEITDCVLLSKSDASYFRKTCDANGLRAKCRRVKGTDLWRCWKVEREGKNA